MEKSIMQMPLTKSAKAGSMYLSRCGDSVSALNRERKGEERT